LSHPTLDGNGVKAMPGRFKYPILVHSIQYLKRKKIQVKKNKGFSLNVKLSKKDYIIQLGAIQIIRDTFLALF